MTIQEQEVVVKQGPRVVGDYTEQKVVAVQAQRVVGDYTEQKGRGRVASPMSCKQRTIQEQKVLVEL